MKQGNGGENRSIGECVKFLISQVAFLFPEGQFRAKFANMQFSGDFQPESATLPFLTCFWVSHCMNGSDFCVQSWG